MFDGDAFGAKIVEVVTDYVERRLVGIRGLIDKSAERLSAVEARQPEKGETGAAGQDGEPGAPGETGERGTDGAIGVQGEQGPAGPAGKDGETGVKGEPGDRGEDGAIGAQGEQGPAGESGKDGLSGPPGEKGADGLPGADGKAGVGLAEAFEDKAGNLVLIMTDGRAKAIGLIRGKDGEPGRDGLGFEDMDEAIEDGGRVIVRRYKRGEDVKEFRHQTNVMVYRGVFRQGSGPFAIGDVVTWSGCLWHCDMPTSERPRESKSWKLIVRGGNDAKRLEPDDVRPMLAELVSKAVDVAVAKAMRTAK